MTTPTVLSFFDNATESYSHVVAFLAEDSTSPDDNYPAELTSIESIYQEAWQMTRDA